MKYALICLFLAVFACPAFARLGETYEQCLVRYGKPEEYAPPDVEGVNLLPGTKYVVWFKNSIQIEARFYENKCVILQFTRYDGNNETNMEIEECIKLLNASAGNSKWDVSNFKKEDVIYRDDKKAKGFFYNNRRMIIENIDYLNEVEIYKKKKKMDDLKNF